MVYVGLICGVTCFVVYIFELSGRRAPLHTHKEETLIDSNLVDFDDLIISCCCCLDFYFTYIFLVLYSPLPITPRWTVIII